MTSRNRKLDGRLELVTPENIAFEYRIAGPFFRLPAYLIDMAILAASFAVTLFVFTLTLGVVGLDGIGLGVWLIVTFLLMWFYGGVFETFWNGQTPGKRMLGLRVVSIDGQPITALQAILRNILRAADAMPPLAFLPFPSYLVGLTCAAMNPSFQRLGDLACGTLVIIEEPHRLSGVLRFDEPEVVGLAAELPPNFVATHNLARALSKYVGRRKKFAPARRAEIARHLGQPLVERFNLPPNTSHDLLLCALYYRTFISDRPLEERPVAAQLVPVTMVETNITEFPQLNLR